MTKLLTLKELLAVEDITEKIANLKFEEGLKLVEELVRQVESGTLPLDQSIRSYSHGTTIIAKLQELLGSAEAKLKMVTVGKSSNPQEV